MPVIIELTPETHEHFAAHRLRHRAESGNGGIHFMPFAPADPDGPKGVGAMNLIIPVGAQKWERCFVVVESGTDTVFGHVNLRGGHLKVGLHRCELGLGLELAYRGQGLGTLLMQKAIAFAKAQPELHWIDLSTFAINTPARTLYQKLGFSEVGIIPDRFRIQDESIADVLMTLNVK